MTMHASRESVREIKVQFTYGPATASITEDAGHLRAFWAQLGDLLNTIEKEGSTDGAG